MDEDDPSTLQSTDTLPSQPPMDEDDPSTLQSTDTLPSQPPMDEDELKSFFRKISHSKSKPANLSLIPEFQDRFIPKSTFPKCLHDLYDPSLAKVSYPDLLTSCESVHIELSDEMVCNVEEANRAQNKSRLWYRYRAGRVTASKTKQVCRTSSEMPSQCLIKEIYYPNAFKFTSKATSWGIDHESAARERYIEQMTGVHEEFSVSNSGLVLNTKWPHLGASPDGILNCTWCGKGVLEIKCPFSHRHNSIEDISSDSQSSLKMSDSDKLYSDHDHAYYFQVQAQIFVCQVEYSDFCICTFPPAESVSQIYIERIYPDEELWKSCIEKSISFFQRLAYYLNYLEGGLHEAHLSQTNLSTPMTKLKVHVVMMCVCSATAKSLMMVLKK